MATKITIDPITRIEGHLKIEVEVDNGVVTNAFSSGTLFRGVETILTGREPEDAWLFTQRLCGVCTYVHGVASVRSVENAINLTIPEKARIVRNLLMGGQYIHDHPVHFYHLHALDWVDIVSALSADPSATAALALSISPHAQAIDFTQMKQRLQTFVDSGQLGPFAGAYWGHQAYRLTAEENLLFASHYLYALREQVKAAKMHALFGAKNPHLQSIRVGGVTNKHDITSQSINQFKTYLSELRRFIDTIYKPDVEYLAGKYSDWGSIGGFGHYLSYGEFPLSSDEPAALFLPGGVVFNGNTSGVENVDLAKITEHVQHSWYEGTTERHPEVGETKPAYTGYNTDSRYSWLKAPRYNGEPMEVGPLARVMVAYGRGHTHIVNQVNQLLTDTGLQFSALHSTLGRVAARMIETKIIGDAMAGWIDQLQTTGSGYVSPAIPAEVQGVGLNEAPRGALGHWIDIRQSKIGNYQMVVPSTWNLGPRCSANKRGPVEEALIGTPVADASQPVEILRVVHSFDPCLACAVHVIDRKNNTAYTVQVVE